MKLTESALRKIIKEELEGQIEKMSHDDLAWEIIYDLMNLHLIAEKTDDKRLDIAHTYIMKRLSQI